MGNEEAIGRLERVPVRSVWKLEDENFTPWLGKNLDQLGEALNLNLEFVEEEGEVGPFRVDVVAEEDAGLVVIENQLERTDHDHLGKLLTYAAGRNARVLIWICPDFQEEHRAALDWLNQWTSDEIAIYGVEVGAVRIGESVPAAEFRPISAPNAWVRSSKRQRSSDSSDQREFFRPMVEELRSRGLSVRKSTQNRGGVKIFPIAEATDIYYRIRFWRQTQTSVHLWIGFSELERNHYIFDQLAAKKTEIESRLGREMSWERERGRKSAIRVVGEGSISGSPEQLEQLRADLIETVTTLMDAVDPLLSEVIDAADEESDSE